MPIVECSWFMQSHADRIPTIIEGEKVKELDDGVKIETWTGTWIAAAEWKIIEWLFYFIAQIKYVITFVVLSKCNCEWKAHAPPHCNRLRSQLRYMTIANNNASASWCSAMTAETNGGACAIDLIGSFWDFIATAAECSLFKCY